MTDDASLDDPVAFWGRQATLVDWFVRPRTILDRSTPAESRWFPDGTLNTCYNALDRHVIRGRADQTALIYDSPVTGAVQTLTYSRLLERVAAFAGVLRNCGIGVGDRVAIWMPMVPEAVIAMLATARVGAVHAVFPEPSSAAALAGRIDALRPKVVVTASCGVEPGGPVEYKPVLDEALVLARHLVDVVIVKQRPQLPADLVAGRDIDFDVALRAGMGDPAPCVPVAGDHPLYLLDASGARGEPGGVVRDNGGHAVALTWAMQNVFDMSAGQVWLTSSELSSVVAHSGLVYAPLFAGVTSVLYEGLGATDAGAIWRLVADHNVEGVLAAADLVGAVQDEDREGNAMRPEQPSALRHVFLAGGHLDLDNDDWASQVLGVPVTHTWWQNEFGWPLVTMRGLEPLSDTTGSASQPWPGCDLRILDERGEELPPGRTGSICVRLPLPPGAMTAPWGDEERRASAPPVSYDGYYRSCCCGYRDEDGYVSVTGAMPPL